MKSVKMIIISILLILPAMSAGAPPTGTDWGQVFEFSDEFNGGSLDSSKWRDYHPYWSGRDSTFEPSNVSVSGGYLRLVSSLYPGSTEVNANTVTAACVSSKNRNCDYGYYETRMMSSNLSMTSSFWFQGRFSEIYVLDSIGNASDTTHDWI